MCLKLSILSQLGMLAFSSCIVVTSHMREVVKSHSLLLCKSEQENAAMANSNSGSQGTSEVLVSAFLNTLSLDLSWTWSTQSHVLVLKEGRFLPLSLLFGWRTGL